MDARSYVHVGDAIQKRSSEPHRELCLNFRKQQQDMPCKQYNSVEHPTFGTGALRTVVAFPPGVAQAGLQLVGLPVVVVHRRAHQGAVMIT
jgi:hypothetical protein